MSIERKLRDEAELISLYLAEAQREGEFEMDLEEIYQAILAEINALIVLSKRPDQYIVDFNRYKPLYDMLIALRTAQALEGINEKLERITEQGGYADLATDCMSSMSSWLHAIAENGTA